MFNAVLPLTDLQTARLNTSGRSPLFDGMFSSDLVIQGDFCVHADFMCLLIFNADF